MGLYSTIHMLSLFAFTMAVVPVDERQRDVGAALVVPSDVHIGNRSAGQANEELHQVTKNEDPSPRDRRMKWANEKLWEGITGSGYVVGPLVRCAFYCRDANNAGVAVRDAFAEAGVAAAQITVKAVASLIPVVGPALGRVMSEIIGIFFRRARRRPGDQPPAITRNDLDELEKRMQKEMRTLAQNTVLSRMLTGFALSTRTALNRYTDYTDLSTAFNEDKAAHDPAGLHAACGHMHQRYTSLQTETRALIDFIHHYWQPQHGALLREHTVAARYVFERASAVVSAYTSAHVHYDTMCLVLDEEVLGFLKVQIRRTYTGLTSDWQSWFGTFYEDYHNRLEATLRFHFHREHAAYCTRQEHFYNRQCNIRSPASCATGLPATDHESCDAWRTYSDHVRDECGGAKYPLWNPWPDRPGKQQGLWRGGQHGEGYSGVGFYPRAWTLKLCENSLSTDGQVQCLDNSQFPALSNVWQDIRGFNFNSMFITVHIQAETPRNVERSGYTPRRAQRKVNCGSLLISSNTNYRPQTPGHRTNGFCWLSWRGSPNNRLNGICSPHWQRRNDPDRGQSERQFAFLRQLAISTSRVNAIISMVPVASMATESVKTLSKEWESVTLGPVSYAAVNQDGLKYGNASMVDTVFIGGNMLNQGLEPFDFVAPLPRTPRFIDLGECKGFMPDCQAWNGPSNDTCPHGVGAIVVTFAQKPLWPNTPMKGPHRPVNAILMYGRKPVDENGKVPPAPGIEETPCHSYTIPNYDPSVPEEPEMWAQVVPVTHSVTRVSWREDRATRNILMVEFGLHFDPITDPSFSHAA